MATLKVRKQPTSVSTDRSGLKETRYERVRTAYGTVAAGQFSVGDQIQFPELAAKEILSAEFSFLSGSPTTTKVVPGTDISNGVTLITANNSSKISYRIDYIKGSAAQAGIPLTLKTQVS